MVTVTVPIAMESATRFFGNGLALMLSVVAFCMLAAPRFPQPIPVQGGIGHKKNAKNKTLIIGRGRPSGCRRHL